MSKCIVRDIGERWQQGLDHHPKSVALFKWLADFDYKECGDTFHWKSGGDGDNGETLMYQLDVYFEEQDALSSQAALPSSPGDDAAGG